MADDRIQKLESERENMTLKISMPNINEQQLNPDQEWEKVMRKLSYKMPQTFKYSFVLFLGSGFIHAIASKRASRFFLYPMIGTPILGLGLCYNDFLKMYDIKFNMPKQNKSNI